MNTTSSEAIGPEDLTLDQTETPEKQDKVLEGFLIRQKIELQKSMEKLKHLKTTAYKNRVAELMTKRRFKQVTRKIKTGFSKVRQAAIASSKNISLAGDMVYELYLRKKWKMRLNKLIKYNDHLMSRLGQELYDLRNAGTKESDILHSTVVKEIMARINKYNAEIANINKALDTCATELMPGGF